MGAGLVVFTKTCFCYLVVVKQRVGVTREIEARTACLQHPWKGLVDAELFADGLGIPLTLREVAFFVA